MEKNSDGASTAAASVLALVAVLNLGYAVFLLSRGDEDILPLIIGGIVCGTLAAVLLARRGPPGK